MDVRIYHRYDPLLYYEAIDTDPSFSLGGIRDLDDCAELDAAAKDSMIFIREITSFLGPGDTICDDYVPF